MTTLCQKKKTNNLSVFLFFSLMLHLSEGAESVMSPEASRGGGVQKGLTWSASDTNSPRGAAVNARLPLQKTNINVVLTSEKWDYSAEQRRLSPHVQRFLGTFNRLQDKKKVKLWRKDKHQRDGTFVTDVACLDSPAHRWGLTSLA